MIHYVPAKSDRITNSKGQKGIIKLVPAKCD